MELEFTSQFFLQKLSIPFRIPDQLTKPDQASPTNFQFLSGFQLFLFPPSASLFSGLSIPFRIPEVGRRCRAWWLSSFNSFPDSSGLPVVGQAIQGFIFQFLSGFQVTYTTRVAHTRNINFQFLSGFQNQVLRPFTLLGRVFQFLSGFQLVSVLMGIRTGLITFNSFPDSSLSFLA